MLPQGDGGRVRPEPRTGVWVWIAILVAIGCILRFWHINSQSAWAPETLSVYVAGLSPGDIVKWLILDYKHYLEPPLYYFLLHFWFAVFGIGVMQARFLALCFGVLAIPATYLFARLLVERRIALLATVIFALSQAGVIYSQEARPYSQLTFFFLTTSYLFLRALRERRAVLWWSAALSAVAMVFSHYYGLFALAVLVGYAVARRQAHPIPWRWWGAAALMQAVPAVLWITTIAVRLPITSELLFRGNRSTLGVNVGWRHLPAAIVWLTGTKWFGIESPTPMWLALLGGVVFTLPAVFGTVRLYRAGGERRAGALLLSALCVAPILAIVGLGSLGFNKYLDFENHVRYLVFCAGAYYILVAAGIAAVRPRWARAAGVVLVVLFSIAGLRSVYIAPYKADYRAGVAAIAEGFQAGDCALFYPRTLQLPLLGHRAGLPHYWHVYQPGKTDVRQVELADIVAGRSGCRCVWLFSDHTPWMDRSGEWLKAKEELDRALTKIGERSYLLTEVDLYRSNSGAARGSLGSQAFVERASGRAPAH